MAVAFTAGLSALITRSWLLASLSIVTTLAALLASTVDPASSAPQAAGSPSAPEPPDVSERAETTTAPASAVTPDEPRAALPHGVEPADAVAALAEAGTRVASVLSAHLWLEDAPTGVMRFVAAHGPTPPDATPVEIAASLLGRVTTSGRAAAESTSRVVSPEGRARLVMRYALPVSTEGARGVAALDLLVPADDPPDPGALSRLAAPLRSSLAAALSIHMARQETAAARLLLRAAGELSRQLDPELVAQTALSFALELSSAQTGSVMLSDPGGVLRIVASRGLPARIARETAVVSGEGIAGWVFSDGKPLVVEDLDGRSRPQSRRHGVRSAVSVPIADEATTLGVLNVGNRVFMPRISHVHTEALESLGRMTALALSNARAMRSAQDLYFDTLKALALALETKDPYAQGGTGRVVDLSMRLGRAMGLTESESSALRVASLLHDIGMTAAGELLGASGRPLSTVEWGMLKMHPVIAADILEQAPALHEAIPIVYHHHEHYDGRGYVGGLSGDRIPLGARVLSVVDAYVAMTSDRPYRSALTREAALSELTAKAGTQFDPEVVRTFVELEGVPAADAERL